MSTYWLLICLMLAPLLQGQSGYTQFDILGEAETKLGSNVLDLHQDDHGYIWLSTFNGLIRYNGHQFQFAQDLYPALQDLPTSDISCTLLDQDNTLWIATVKQGIFLLKEDGSLVEFANLFWEDTDLYDNRIRQLTAHQGVIYLKGDQGLVAYALKDSNYQKLELPTKAKEVRQVKALASNIYFCTADQIFTENWKPLEGKLNLSFPFLFVKNRKELWLANHEDEQTNIYKLIEGQWKSHGIQPFEKKNYARNKFLWDNNERIWSFRYTENAICYDFKDNYWLIEEGVNNHNLFDARIRDILVDNSGTVWIGANEVALLRDNPSLLSFRPLVTNGRYIMDMVVGDKSAYYALDGKGLYVINEKGQQHYHTGNSKLVSDRIRSVDLLDKENIGLAFVGGFQVFSEKKGFSEYIPANGSNRFSTFYDGHYWIAGTNQLIKVDQALKQKEYLRMPRNNNFNTYFNSLCLKSEFEWYVGRNQDSLYSFDMRTNTFSTLDLGKMPNHSLTQLHVNTKGDFALGAKNGLFLRPTGDDFIQLNDEYIKSVHWLDDSTLTAASQSKIFAYQWNGNSVKHHIVQENLINSKLSLRSVAKVGDRICFGGDQGLDCIAYVPAENEINYILNIERLTTDQDVVINLLDGSSEVTLPAGTRRLEIAANLICTKFQSAAKILYRYNRGEWQYLKSNLLNLVALNAGQHDLEFRAEMPTSDFNSEIKRLQITITHRWYEKKWVQLLGLFTLLFSSSYGFYRWQNKKRNNEVRDALLRTEIAESKLQSLTGQMRPHFVFNSLNSIQQMIHEQEQEGSIKYIQQFSKMFRFILEYTDQSWVPVHEEIDFIQGYMEMEKMRFDNSFEFSLDIAENLKLQHWAMPPFFIQPSLENALKHGIRQLTSKGQIRLSLSCENEQLHLLIADNGIGLKAAKKVSVSFLSNSEKGITLIQRRVKQLNQLGYEATFKINEKIDEQGEVLGTEVHMILPLQKID